MLAFQKITKAAAEALGKGGRDAMKAAKAAKDEVAKEYGPDDFEKVATEAAKRVKANISKYKP
jgi:hypothetical protein